MSVLVGGAMTGQLARIPVALPAERATLAELAPGFLQWFAFVRRRSPNTVKSYGFDLGAFLEFAELADLHQPEDVTFRHVEFYLGWLQTERGVKASTCNRHLHALRSFWKWMRREGHVTTDAPADTFMLPTQKNLPRYLTAAEQERVFTALAARTSEESTPHRRDIAHRDLALVATALLTGLRCQELANLQLVHLDLEAGVLRVIQGKGGKSRELPVVPRLQGILGAYLADARPRLLDPVCCRSRRARRRSEGAVIRGWESVSSWVFVSGRPGRGARRGRHATGSLGEPLGGKAIFHIVRREVGAILGRHCHPHELRHSFATRIRGNGGDLQIIQEALGHTDIRTTTMYAHLATPARRQRLAELLA